jgi:hypothetical protein
MSIDTGKMRSPSSTATPASGLLCGKGFGDGCPDLIHVLVHRQPIIILTMHLCLFNGQALSFVFSLVPLFR